MRELWGSLSVNDHVRRRALVAEVLLFDRVVVPVPPEGDVEEEQRWARNRWQPKRQKRLLEILGVGGRDQDLAVSIPWTPAKRERFRVLSQGMKAPPPVLNHERAQLLSGLRLDVTQLRPDAFMATRMLLTREHDDREKDFERSLPHVWVEKVVPAYTSFEAANKALSLKAIRDAQQLPSAQVIGWELFVPEDSSWSDERALEAAAALSRKDDYRQERESFRSWWQANVGAGMPAETAVQELVKRAGRINEITRKGERRTRVLRSFAVFGGTVSLVGAWFPPASIAGGAIGLVSLSADWILKDEVMPTSLAPAAMFTDARRHLGWH